MIKQGLLPFLISICCLFFINKVEAASGLSGKYTIDSAKPASVSNYKNFSSAVSDLDFGTRPDSGTPNGKGISGPVIFNVANGFYIEHFTIAKVVGSSPVNTILFQSASGDSSKVVIDDTTLSGSYLIFINSISYLTFKGFTFQRSKGGGIVKTLYTDLNLTFLNNIFYSNDHTSLLFTNDCDLGTGVNNDQDSIVFKNNRFVGGFFGLNFCHAYNEHSNNLILANTFIDNITAMNINDQYNCRIIGNKIKSAKVHTSWGIKMADSYGSVLIKNNMIDIQSDVSIEGIFFQFNYGSSTNRSLIADNMVSIHNSKSSSSVAGIDIWNGYYTDVFYNTVLIDSSNTITSFPLKVANNNSVNTRAINNNLVNRLGKYALGFGGVITNGDSTDYDNLLANGSLINTPAKDYNNISEFLNASPTSQHCLSSGITFKSPSDLHNLTYELHGKGRPLASVTDDIDGDPRDKLTPDIGADENINNHDISIYKIISISPALCKGTHEPLRVIIRNSGENPETNFNIKADISGPLTWHSVYNQLNQIAAGKTDTIVFPDSVSFKDTGVYKILVYSNLAGDQNQYNDTASFITRVVSMVKPTYTFDSLCVETPVTFKNTTQSPDTTIKYYWSFGDSSFSVDKSPAHTFIDSKKYNVQLLITNFAGCRDSVSQQVVPDSVSYTNFTFTINNGNVQFTPLDTTYTHYFWNFGDGNTSTDLKPMHGYKTRTDQHIFSATLSVINKDGCVGSVSELLEIYAAGINSNNKDGNSLSISPDPFTNALTIDYQIEKEGYSNIALYDLNGRLVKEILNKQEIQGRHSCQVNTEGLGLQPGIYYLKCNFDGMIVSRKVVYVR